MLHSKAVLWLSGVILGFLILSALRIGVADLLSNVIKDELSDLIVPVDEIAGELKLLKLISPANPDLYESLARVALIKSAQPALRDQQLTLALDAICQSIRLRPVSPYSWATLLLIKRERHEYDEQFRQALERATTLGPWEPAVQLVVNDAGLSAWPLLPLPDQKRVEENMVRGMKRQAAQILAQVQSHIKDCRPASESSLCPK